MLSAACHPKLGMRNRKDFLLQISHVQCYFTKCEAGFSGAVIWGFFVCAYAATGRCYLSQEQPSFGSSLSCLQQEAQLLFLPEL